LGKYKFKLYISDFRLNTKRKKVRITKYVSRAMAQAVSRRPVTAEARVGFVVDKVALGQVFPCQFHTTGSPLQGKTKKN
jgi:hypothetical protein